MADKNIQMTQRNTANTDWDNLFPKSKAGNIIVTPISGLTGTDVQTCLQNLFQYANDGKNLVRTAVIGKGGSVPTNPTFQQIADGVNGISTGKKVASGTTTTPYIGGVYTLTISSLTFRPTTVIAYISATGGAYTRWAFNILLEDGLRFSAVQATLDPGNGNMPGVDSPYYTLTTTTNGFTAKIESQYLWTGTNTVKWWAFE